jgi:hypothetical protein
MGMASSGRRRKPWVVDCDRLGNGRVRSMAAHNSHLSEGFMIPTPFRFEKDLVPEDFQKLGQLMLRWAARRQ